jgi:hypothetical protein
MNSSTITGGSEAEQQRERDRQELARISTWTVTDRRALGKSGDSRVETAALVARSARDPELAALLRDEHRRHRLWRLCRRAACKRARRCCGDELACGARRWPAARAAPRSTLTAALNHRPRKGIVTRQLGRWSERNGELKPPKVTVRWRMRGEEPGRQRQ